MSFLCHFCILLVSFQCNFGAILMSFGCNFDVIFLSFIVENVEFQRRNNSIKFNQSSINSNCAELLGKCQWNAHRRFPIHRFNVNKSQLTKLIDEIWPCNKDKGVGGRGFGDCSERVPVERALRQCSEQSIDGRHFS